MIIVNDNKGIEIGAGGAIYDTPAPTPLPTFHTGQTYGGGVIFYTDGTNGLICATEDIGDAYWGCYELPIGTSYDIGTGQANTTAIVNGCSQSGIAAKLCNDSTLNGYSDWYLPSKDEMAEIVKLQTEIGNFIPDDGSYTNIYWTSTESEIGSTVTGEYAWYYRFGDAYWDQTPKEYVIAGHTRPIRSF